MPSKRKPRTWTRWAILWSYWPDRPYILDAWHPTRRAAREWLTTQYPQGCPLYATPIKVTITEVLPKPRKPRAKR